MCVGKNRIKDNRLFSSMQCTWLSRAYKAKLTFSSLYWWSRGLSPYPLPKSYSRNKSLQKNRYFLVFCHFYLQKQLFGLKFHFFADTKTTIERISDRVDSLWFNQQFAHVVETQFLGRVAVNKGVKLTTLPCFWYLVGLYRIPVKGSQSRVI